MDEYVWGREVMAEVDMDIVDVAFVPAVMVMISMVVWSVIVGVCG